jgi:hypothetical protein
MAGNLAAVATAGVTRALLCWPAVTCRIPRTGLKEPSTALGSPTRGTPRAKCHPKRPDPGTPRATLRRKRPKPGTSGSHAPPEKIRLRQEKTRRRDAKTQASAEKCRGWYRGEPRLGLPVRCEKHPACDGMGIDPHRCGLGRSRKSRGKPGSAFGQGQSSLSWGQRPGQMPEGELSSPLWQPAPTLLDTNVESRWSGCPLSPCFAGDRDPPATAEVRQAGGSDRSG